MKFFLILCLLATILFSVEADKRSKKRIRSEPEAVPVVTAAQAFDDVNFLHKDGKFLPFENWEEYAKELEKVNPDTMKTPADKDIKFQSCLGTSDFHTKIKNIKKMCIYPFLEMKKKLNNQFTPDSLNYKELVKKLSEAPNSCQAELELIYDKSKQCWLQAQRH